MVVTESAGAGAEADGKNVGTRYVQQKGLGYGECEAGMRMMDFRKFREDGDYRIDIAHVRKAQIHELDNRCAPKNR